jgi:beta-glucosidase
VYFDDARPAKDILSAENREVARRAAAHSFVLLKNHKAGFTPEKSQEPLL